MFEGIEEVRERLAEQRYVCDRRLATVVFLATKIEKPVLVEGPAGVGKTELAKALAAALEVELIRLQCYEGLDEAKALYEWEYGKQLLYTQVLREKIGELLGPTKDLHEAAAALRDQEDVFFSESFLVERPILRALRAERSPVLLIDEIDRADEEFEAFLLEFLSDFQVSIPEIGTVKAQSPPIVVLTSNRSRELSEALKRRCLHLQLDYPGPDTELEIVRLKAPGIGEELAGELVRTIQRLRGLDLRKAPSIGETLDWAQALVVLGADHLDKELTEETLSVIIKYDRDAEKVRRELGAGANEDQPPPPRITTTTEPVDRVIRDFIGLLRRHRVRVSPAEGLDALEGLRHVGLGEREGVRDTLRATLVKSEDDIETYERLFELYFGLQAEPAPAARLQAHVHDPGGTATELRFGEDLEGDPDDGDHDHSHAGPDPIDLRRFLSEEHLRPSQDIHGDSERLRLSVFGQQLMLNRNPEALQQALRATHQLRVKRARSFKPGSIAPESGAEELPIDLPAVGLDELTEDLRELGVDERLVQALAAQADDVLKALPEILEQLQARRRQLSEGGLDDEEITRRSLRQLLDLSPGDQRELEAALRRLGRQIHGARGRRLRRDRTGRISVSHTLRRNAGYEGIPFKPVLRRRRDQRPRLVVLCDVSLSTRNLARFWLHLVYGLQDLFSKVRTFVFVADATEVTQLFEEQALEDAVETIFSGRLIDVDENSDFGRAAEQIGTDLAAAINRRTTVVVLGDGRNNGRPPNERALEETAARARRLIWITPEPKWSWTLGGCDMPRYEPICDRVEVVRNADELAAVAETMVRDG